MASKETEIKVEDTQTVEAEVVTKEEASLTTIHLSKPYKFEDEIVTFIDLAGMENVTARDMIAGQKFLSRTGDMSITPEITLEYACFMASKVTGRPIEFFYGLPPRDAVKLKNKMMGFFYGES